MEVMFADDINLFLCPKKIVTLFATMNVELENVSTWFKSNKLSVNVDKTKWLLFHTLPKRQLFPQTLPNPLIENIHIKREHAAKFIGKFTDENLFWKQHIDIISSKIAKSIGILYQSRNVLSKQCRNQLYFSFIHNYINHTNIVRENTRKSKFERLYPCQKHTACVIYHKDLYTHASPLTNDMKALKCFPIKYV